MLVYDCSDEFEKKVNDRFIGNSEIKFNSFRKKEI